MKIKHIQYRSGLLIGLLSLNILSSCANTRQKMGMGPGLSKDKSKNESSGWKQKTAWGLTAAGLAAASGIAGHHKGYSSGYNEGFSDGKSGCSNRSLGNSNNSNTPHSWNSTTNTSKGKMDFPDPYKKKK